PARSCCRDPGGSPREFPAATARVPEVNRGSRELSLARAREDQAPAPGTSKAIPELPDHHAEVAGQQAGICCSLSPFTPSCRRVAGHRPPFSSRRERRTKNVP